ncbi:Ubiquitin carboxyl-terminal hydrolase [Mycena venus]|uniref:Ubiquitin carboxyl-terminal hydrolase n=1 Tax=Mycena venus TaxID=2733690 RepID=A0A8H7CLH4_9AGAR|nr:Ubiquitin carboxyl-terminal hydrolase [Mycena venus]
MDNPKERLHFIPLESDPEIFTNLIQALGVHSLEFQDVLSLDLADLLPGGDLALSGPVHALILIFPTTEAYEAELKAEKRIAHSEGTNYTGHGPTEPVIWFEQTIHNACGLYAILHAISNLDSTTAELSIDPESLFARFLSSCIPYNPEKRAQALEESLDIAEAHRRAANQGSTAVPRAEDEVNFHYVCFVKSPLNGHLYDLDGDKNGPVDRDAFLEGDRDMLSAGLKLVRSYIKDGNPNFQLMALVPTSP